jgi:hypothetical protein
MPVSSPAAFRMQMMQHCFDNLAQHGRERIREFQVGLDCFPFSLNAQDF